MNYFSNQRLRIFVNYLKISGRVKNDKDFAEKLGYHRTGISEMMSCKRPVSEKFIASLASQYPILNPEWLLNESVENMLNPDNIHIVDAASYSETYGSHNTAGRDVHVQGADPNSVIEVQRQTIEHLQQQIEKLTGIIEKLTSR